MSQFGHFCIRKNNYDLKMISRYTTQSHLWDSFCQSAHVSWPLTCIKSAQPGLLYPHLLCLSQPTHLGFISSSPHTLSALPAQPFAPTVESSPFLQLGLRSGHMNLVSFRADCQAAGQFQACQQLT